MTLYTHDWYLNQAKDMMKQVEELVSYHGYTDARVQQLTQMAIAYATISKAMKP